MHNHFEDIFKSASHIEQIQGKDLWMVKIGTSYGIIDGRGVWLFPPEFAVLTVFPESSKGTLVISRKENRNAYWLQNLEESQPIFNEPITWVCDAFDKQGNLPNSARLANPLWEIQFQSGQKILWKWNTQEFRYDVTGFKSIHNQYTGCYAVSHDRELYWLYFDDDNFTPKKLGINGIDFIDSSFKSIIDERALLVLGRSTGGCSHGGSCKHERELYFIKANKSISLSKCTFEGMSSLDVILVVPNTVVGLNPDYAGVKAYDVDTGDLIVEGISSRYNPVLGWGDAFNGFYAHVDGKLLRVEKKDDKWEVATYDDIRNAYKHIKSSPMARNWGAP